MDIYIVGGVILVIISILSFLFFRYISTIENGVMIIKKDLESLKATILEGGRQPAEPMTNQMKQNLESIQQFTNGQDTNQHLENINLGEPMEANTSNINQENYENNEDNEEESESNDDEEEFDYEGEDEDEDNHNEMDENNMEEDNNEEDNNMEEDNMEDNNMEEDNNEEDEDNDGIQIDDDTLRELDMIAEDNMMVEYNNVDEDDNNDSTIITEDTIRSMKVGELRNLANDMGVENVENLKKPELKELLIQKLSADKINNYEPEQL